MPLADRVVDDRDEVGERRIVDEDVDGTEDLLDLGDRGVIEVDYDDGKIVMYGFRVQHRAQTQGTFKLFFNALYMTQ